MSPARLHFVRLTLGGLELALPQAEVRSVEPVGELAGEAAHGCVGQIRLAGEIWSIFSFNDELALNAQVGDEARACVLLNAGRFFFGIVCRAVSTFDAAMSDKVPVPACMRRTDSVVEDLLVFDDGIVCVTSSARLVRYLRRLGVDPKSAARPPRAVS